MGKFYKICMVIVKQHFRIKMQTRNNPQECAFALKSFMGRSDNEQSGSKTSTTNVVIDLLRSPTGYSTCPFVNTPITGPFWTPPKDPEPVREERAPVVPQTLFQQIKFAVSGLIKHPVSVETFVDGVAIFGFPNFAIVSILEKMGLVCEKNGNRIVCKNIGTFVNTLVRMKEIVDFLTTVLVKLRVGSIFWKHLLNPNNSDFIETSLSNDDMKKLLSLLTSLGFNSGLADKLSLPADWRSLSTTNCSNQVWNVVSIWDWNLPLPPKKRGRNDEDETPPKKKELEFSKIQLIKTIVVKLMLFLLATHGVRNLSLSKFFSTAFLDLCPDHLRQIMDFLYNKNHVWILNRILMEIPKLKLDFLLNGDVCLSMEEGFSFTSFNMKDMLLQIDLLFLEAIMHHQVACQEIREKEVQRSEENSRINRFRNAIWSLWKKKDVDNFFQELIAVCPEFDSKHTNNGLLQIVAKEFISFIYNSTTRNYHNRDPCANPLQDFLEYATIRGVFSPKAPQDERIRVCDYPLENCPFGQKCSGVHQDFVSLGWKEGTVWGMCCQHYAESGTCRNKNCGNAHFTGDEYYRASRNGGRESNRMRNDLIVQAFIAEGETVNTDPM